jgi:hypothetical protein
MEEINILLKEDFIEMRGIFEEEMESIDNPQTPEEFYGGNYEDVFNRYKMLLEKNGYVRMPGHSNRRREELFSINYLIEKVELP